MVVSGRPAPVHHIFWPLTRKWSPRSWAEVRRAAASDPLSGSLTATASRCRPVMIWSRMNARCASVPQLNTVMPGMSTPM